MTNKLLPHYTWIDGLSYEFRIPMTLNGMKELKIRTKTYGGKDVWARIKGNRNSILPSYLRMKDITFGVIYKDNGGEIDWYTSQQTLDSNDIDSFCFKGTAMTNAIDYRNTYNPFTKFSEWQLRTLLRNRRLQTSLWRIISAYKTSGAWDEMLDTKLDIENITTKLSKHNMWKILTKNLSIKDFIVPNPALSLRLETHIHPANDGEIFNFLFTNKANTKQQTLTEWIKENPAPKPNLSADDFYEWEEWLDSLNLQEREHAIQEYHQVIEEDEPF